MNNTYDFIVIVVGISASTFSSFLNKRFSDASILLVEQGRRIWGRATTRKLRKNQFLEFDYGLPSINFSKNCSQDILQLIAPLINSRKLVDISKNILLMNKFGSLNDAYTDDKIFLSLPFMANFCEEIIKQATNPKKLIFCFKYLLNQ